MYIGPWSSSDTFSILLQCITQYRLMTSPFGGATNNLMTAWPSLLCGCISKVECYKSTLKQMSTGDCSSSRYALNVAVMLIRFFFDSE